MIDEGTLSGEDWEVEETEVAPDEESEPSVDYEIMNYPADITLQGYVDYFDKSQLEVPKFQRRYVWDRVRASKLIESFLLGLPVPGTFLYKKKSDAAFQIIDGQQRIKSVIRFMKGVFDEKVFRLRGVDARYEGKSFSELSEDDQFRLQGTVLRATVIQQINPNDDTSIYHIFERLNTGGMNLNPMEVRQCVSYGPFIDALEDMNKDSFWRQIIGKPNEDKRLRDMELVLRCIAISENGDDYEKPMKGFLNKYAEEKRGENDFDAMKDNFSSTCEHIIHTLGEKPFHLRGRLNYGALDSVMATLLKYEAPADTKAWFNALLADESYQEAITYNTSDESVVETRLEKASDALTE